MNRTLLMVDVAPPGTNDSEAEGLTVECYSDHTCRLVLDDGTQIICDKDELVAALSPARVEVVA